MFWNKKEHTKQDCLNNCPGEHLVIHASRNPTEKDTNKEAYWLNVKDGLFWARGPEKSWVLLTIVEKTISVLEPKI